MSDADHNDVTRPDYVSPMIRATRPRETPSVVDGLQHTYPIASDDEFAIPPIPATATGTHTISDRDGIRIQPISTNYDDPYYDYGGKAMAPRGGQDAIGIEEAAGFIEAIRRTGNHMRQQGYGLGGYIKARTGEIRDEWNEKKPIHRVRNHVAGIARQWGRILKGDAVIGDPDVRDVRYTANDLHTGTSRAIDDLLARDLAEAQKKTQFLPNQPVMPGNRLEDLLPAVVNDNHTLGAGNAHHTDIGPVATASEKGDDLFARTLNPHLAKVANGGKSWGDREDMRITPTGPSIRV